VKFFEKGGDIGLVGKNKTKEKGEKRKW